MSHRVDAELFRRVVEQAAMALVVVDTQGRMLYVNQALLSLLDYAQDELNGQPIERLLPARFHEVHQGHRSGFLAHPERRPMGQGRDLVAVTKTGREVPVEVGLHPVNTPEGLLVAAVVVDITDRLHQQQINERHDRLEAVGFLAGGLAHDYNNVLAGILGNVDLLAKTVDLDPKAQQRVETIRRLVTKGSQIARRLITFSKGGAPVSVAVNLVPLVREAAETAAAGTGVAVRCLVSSDPMTARVDPGQFGQVVTNLVINAVQALGGTGTVVVSGGFLDVTSADLTFGVPPGRYVHWAVHDDGPGIPADLQAKIFDPFFTTKAHGSGLGLAIVHSVLTQHGGAVTVQSSPDLGTTFELVIPAASALPDDEQLRTTPFEVICQDSGRVLVMDDNKDLREAVVLALEQCGFEVTSCRQGDEALGQIGLALDEGRPFGLAILDVMVPGHLGGVDVVHALGHQGVNLPVVLMSGYSEADVVGAVGGGVNGYLHKPFALADLLREVERVRGRLTPD